MLAIRTEVLAPVTLSIGIIMAPLAADAQQPAKAPRVGLLLQGTSASLMTRLEGFYQGLRDPGIFLSATPRAGTGAPRGWARPARIPAWRDAMSSRLRAGIRRRPATGPGKVLG
jgi:hypothetical protein